MKWNKRSYQRYWNPGNFRWILAFKRQPLYVSSMVQSAVLPAVRALLA